MVHANTEVKKKYRSSPIDKGDCETFARSLVAMERFAHMDPEADVAFLEASVQEMGPVLKRFREDLRVNVTGLSSVSDMCDSIIRLSEDDPEYFKNAAFDESKAEAQRVPAKFKAAVFDAWNNITTLQAEKHANGLAKAQMLQLDALLAASKKDSVDTTDTPMTLDEFVSNVTTTREALNHMLQEDKDLFNERLLLKSMADLQQVNDPDAINVATRETKLQLENIQVVQQNKDALKDVHAVFKEFLEGDEAQKNLAKAKLMACIGTKGLSTQQAQLIKDHGLESKDYAEIVILLEALEADAAPLRSALIMAAMIIEGTYKDEEVVFVQQQVISPAVMLHCSLPESAELNSLMAIVQGIVDDQKGSVTVTQQVDTLNRASAGFAKVQEAMDKHRAQLTFRSRLAFKKRAEENVDLRPAEKTGAEWDGFHVEDVDLKSWQDTRTPCERAFEDFDLDKNGIITITEVIDYLLTLKPEERPKGLEDVNPFNKTKMKKRLQKMDTDSDGTLSFEEFSAWWEANEREAA